MQEAGARDLTGQRLGPYQLEAPLGDGAFGRVYRARHVALDIPRAVKVMLSQIALDPEFRERFQREARTAAQLHHPNIVAVFDFGSEGELQYLVMEYIESTTLADQLARKPVPGRLADPAVRGWLRDVAAGLDHAHAWGIVHRDLKPANVLIRTAGGRAMLTDFGIAQARTDPKLTVAGNAVGTYAYMAPEQCEGTAEPTGACDVYAFAALIYEVATGDPPYGRGISAVSGHMEKPMPALRLRVPGLPQGLDAVLARGLAKAPRDRYGTATELADAVLRAVSERAAPERAVTFRPEPVAAPDVTVPPRPVWTPPARPIAVPETPRQAPRAPLTLPRPRIDLPRPSPRVVAAVGAALLAVALLVVVVRLVSQQPRPAPPPPSQPNAGGGIPAPVRGSLGTPMQVAGLRLTVLAVDPGADAPKSLQLPASQRFVTVRVVYQGGDDGSAIVSPYDWVVSDRTGAVYGAMVDGVSGPLPERMLGSGQNARGQIGFVIPKSAQGLVLHFDAERGNESAQVPLD